MNKWCTKSRRNRSLYVYIWIYSVKFFQGSLSFFLTNEWRFVSTPQPMDFVMRAPSGLSREGLQRVEPCGKLGIHQSAASSGFSSRKTKAWLQAAQWWRGQGEEMDTLKSQFFWQAMRLLKENICYILVTKHLKRYLSAESFKSTDVIYLSFAFESSRFWLMWTLNDMLDAFRSSMWNCWTPKVVRSEQASSTKQQRSCTAWWRHPVL